MRPMFRRLMMPLTVLSGGILGVTLLAAARTTDRMPSPTSEVGGNEVGPRVVTYGYADVREGLISVFPKDFPNPAEVTEVLVKEGDTVTKGQVLMRFNTELTKLRIDSAKAGLAQVEAGIKAAQTAIDSQKFAVEAQQAVIEGKAEGVKAAEIELAQAQKEFDRKNGVSQFDLDRLKAKIAGLRKEIVAEQNRLEVMKMLPVASKLEDAKGSKGALEAQIKVAEYGMKFAELKSEYDGVILRQNAHAGTTFGLQTRSPAFLIQPKGPLIVRAEVEQEFAYRLVKDMPVAVYNEFMTTMKWTGKVVSIPDAFMPKRPLTFGSEPLLNTDNSRVMECIIQVDIDKDSPKLRLGQKVRVEFGK